MALYRDQGVVLRTIRLGEADRIVTFVTQGRGKVRAVAKGVRKTKSRFGARLEPISHVSLLLYEGRELDIVSQAESLDHFRAIRDDLDRVGRAVNMLEAVDQVAQEREPNPRLYQLLVGALRALAAHDNPLVPAAFFWKLLSLEGAHPVLHECASCGVEDGLSAFDLAEGGVLCRACRRGSAISPEALDLLRLVLGGGLSEALARPHGKAGTELEHLAERTLEHHLERRLRSLGVLDGSGRSR
ncbi:MAG TPA: DNA repair protein RecO [Acidimicrobiales bacterium]|nr:DNA repair protein RecO [Acidimicrobiales bacterium]